MHSLHKGTQCVELMSSQWLPDENSTNSWWLAQDLPADEAKAPAPTYSLFSACAFLLQSGKEESPSDMVNVANFMRADSFASSADKEVISHTCR